MDKKSYLILTGEVSGDVYAQMLINQFSNEYPDTKFYVVSKKLKGPNITNIINEDISRIMGLTEILSSIMKIRRIRKQIVSFVTNNELSAIITIDFSGFNIHIAKKLYHINNNLIYFVPPKIWIWWSSRGKTISRLYKLVIPLFKFEDEFYTQFGCKTFYAGHPLLDSISNQSVNKKDIYNELNFIDISYTIGLFPGSRDFEIQNLFPIMLEAIQIIRKQIPGVQILLIVAPDTNNIFLSQQIQKYDFNIKIIKRNDKFYDYLSILDYAICASGTVSLELGLKNIPTTIIYKFSTITYLIAKMFVKTKFVGLPNIVANEEIMRELLQNDATPENIAAEVQNFFLNEDYNKLIHNRMTKIKKQLSGRNIMKQITDYIYNKF